MTKIVQGFNSLDVCNDFIKKFNETVEPSASKTWILSDKDLNFDVSFAKPSNFKTQEIADIANKCILFIKRHSSYPLDDRIQSLSCLNNSLSLFATRIENSIKNRWWYCILHFFGYEAKCPKNIRNLIDLSKLAIDELSDVNKPNNEILQTTNGQIENKEQIEKNIEPFDPYNVTVIYPDKKENTHEVFELAHQEKMIKELAEFFQGKHSSIQLQGLTEKAIKTFKQFFEVESESYNNGSYQCFVSSKIKESLNHADKDRFKTTTIYENGVKEEFISTDVYDVTNGVRYFPDGTVEKGEFHLENSCFQLFKGYCFKNGEYTFYRGGGLLGSEKNEDLNFVEIETDSTGQRELLILQKANGKYMPYKGSSSDSKMFLTIVQNQNQDLITKVLSHPKTPINVQQFINFLFDCCEELDSELPILKLNSTQAWNVISISKTLGIVLELQDPEVRVGMFNHWVIKGNKELIKFMLDIDPTLIKEAPSNYKSFLAAAIMSHKPREMVEMLREAMQKQKMDLSEEDQWL